MENKRLIDANALLESIEGTDWYTINYKGDATQGAPCEEVAWYKATDIYSAIEDAPTVDAVEVVRCKDCKSSLIGGKACSIFVSSGLPYICTAPDGFCSKGERRMSDDGKE